jgi:hypothetical protein
MQSKIRDAEGMTDKDIIDALRAEVAELKQIVLQQAQLIKHWVRYQKGGKCASEARVYKSGMKRDT